VTDPTHLGAGAATAPARISGPVELIAAIPYLLGFRVEDSLVLIGLNAGHLVVTARGDLADVDGPAQLGPTSGPSAVGDLLDDTVATLRRAGSSELAAVVFTSTRPAPDHHLPHAGLADRLTCLAENRGLAVRDVLLVAAERWWSYRCDDATCCPAQGRPVAEHTSAFTAHAVLAGIAPLPDRAALAATLDPTGEQPSIGQMLAAEAAAINTTLIGAAQSIDRSPTRDLFAAAHAEHPQPLTLPEIARFGVALRETALRDEVWLAIDEQRLDGRDLWRALATRLPDPHAAAPLFLYAWASWRAGNAVLAGIAADRALASDPDYSAAQLLLAALAQGIDPRQMPPLRHQQSA
jgi:hypothetical protein